MKMSEIGKYIQDLTRLEEATRAIRDFLEKFEDGKFPDLEKTMKKRRKK